MNVRYSRCMNRFSLILGIALLACVTASGQHQFDRLMRTNLWNDGTNAAGIRMGSREMSAAELGGSYETGDFRDMSQSGSQWSVSAGARSVRHLDRFSMKGSFDFSNVEAYDMCGSMFMDRNFFPIDVMEFTPGRKTIQSYGMTGAVAVDMDSRWKVGLGLDFKSRNASKRKDLRYSAYRLDMQLTPSVLYSSGKTSFGAGFIFIRNTETVSAEQKGSAETAPFAFFNEGLGLGNWQVWTGNGSRLKESGVTGLPVRQNRLGGSVQYSRDNMYAHVTALWLDGTVGERQTIWYRYSGPEIEAHLAAESEGHTLRGTFQWYRLTNRETVQDKVTEGGISLVKEHGSNEIFKSNSLLIGLDYEYGSQDWDAGLDFTLSDLQRMAAPMYPYIYSRDLKTLCAKAMGRYRFGRWEIGLSAGYMTAAGSDSERTTGSATALSVPVRKDDVYNDCCGYETAGRILLGAFADWRFSDHLHAVLSDNSLLAPSFYGSFKARSGISLSISYIY